MKKTKNPTGFVPNPQRPPKEIKTFEDILEQCGKFHMDTDKIIDTCVSNDIFDWLRFYVIGGFGKFQFIVLLILLFPEIPASFVAFAPVFVGKTFCSNLNVIWSKK